MDENELRAAMRTTITHAPEPPPMESASAVAAGRRAARWRNALAGTGAAAAILAITLAAIPGQGHFGGGTGIPVAAEPSQALEPFPTGTPRQHASAPESGVPSADNTKPSWPAEASGDATADSGQHFEHGKQLLAELLKVVPDGYTALDGSATNGLPFRYDQATAEGDYWAYLVSVAVSKGDRTGQLLVEVHEPGNDLATDPCALAKAFWGIGGPCKVRTVGSARVGVGGEPGGRTGVDQWAAYRHTDGTVVYLVQGLAANADPANGLKPLTELPFTVRELAELATDRRFR